MYSMRQPFHCMPCMVINYVVQVHYVVCSDQLLVQGEGIYREENPKEAGGKVSV